LFGVLSRLAFQKGLDVLVRVLEDLLSAGAGQFALIGSGERFLEDHLHYLAGKYPEKIGFISGYAPDQTAHLLEAGCDFFIMPSRYEPCGLNQMYSMRYGTLPIVRFTGGLADTVQNLDLKNIAGSTGFVFRDLTEEALRNTVRWASSIYKERPEIIREMRIHAMKQDFSWNRTASLYEQMYHDAHQ
jgi:starch synthase